MHLHPSHLSAFPFAGPLTNIALAAKLNPDLPSLIRRLVVMGGAQGPGNMSPHAVCMHACDYLLNPVRRLPDMISGCPRPVANLCMLL